MLPNKTTVLANRASEIAALKALIGTPVSPTEDQLKAMDTIADLRSRKRPVPADVDATAKSFDPSANSSFEHTTGFLFGLILELADKVEALQPAPTTAAAPAPTTAAAPAPTTVAAPAPITVATAAPTTVATAAAGVAPAVPPILQ
jgi:hypothetical protein